MAKIKAKSNWIAGAIKRPGRFKGKNIADLEAILASDSADKSLKAGAALAIRFKRHEFGRGKIRAKS